MRFFKKNDAISKRYFYAQFDFLIYGQCRDDHFYLFSFIKALNIKLVKTVKYGRNISRIL